MLLKSRLNDPNTAIVLGKKAHLLEDKQIPSVFSTWMAFGGNTDPGDGVATIKRWRHDIHGDGVRDSVTASGCGRLRVVYRLLEE
ncbi:hypothetical protein Tco_1303727 [Tanacetum coccineum]